MNFRNCLLFCVTLIFCTVVFAGSDKPHFYLQMENKSSKAATISFSPVVGNIYLTPTLNSQTVLNPHQQSQKYEVHIEPMSPSASFNMTFTGKQACTFNLAYYAPGNPKVTVSGPGCFGGGYAVIDNGHTLLLYISDIHI